MANNSPIFVFGRHARQTERFTESSTKVTVKKDWPAVLNAYRSQHSLTQEQLARQLTVSLRALQSWEQGHRSPRSDVAARIDKLCCSE